MVKPQMVIVWIALAVSSGCAWRAEKARVPGSTPTLRVTHHVGGTHYRTLVHEGVWYQTFGLSLLVVDPRTAAVVTAVELGEPGQWGPATDLTIAAGRLYVILEDDAVVELDRADPRAPRLVRRVGAVTLGLAPKRLSVVRDELYVSGANGVVRWSDGLVLLAGRGEAGRVAASRTGPVACAARRVYRLDDGEYVGSASDLQPLPEAFGWPDRLVFTRKYSAGTLVGLMSDDVREVDANAATVAVPGDVRSVRAFAGRLWIVTDNDVRGYAISGDRLVDPIHIGVSGARDVGRLGPDLIAVAGSLGRAIVRLDAGGPASGPAVVAAVRAPSGLVRAQSDGYQILAGGDEGAWLYHVGQAAEPSTRPTDDLVPAPTEAATLGGAARISDDGRAVEITGSGGERSFAETGGPQINCLAAVDGDLWIGHDRGITVLCLRAPDPVKGRLRLEGRVRYVMPLVGGRGAAYVSEHGGFGVARFVPDDAVREEPFAVSH
ncbi:MAG: hypothetical protein ACYS0G_09240 [Planctomycetota bacterium]